MYIYIYIWREFLPGSILGGLNVIFSLKSLFKKPFYPLCMGYERIGIKYLGLRQQLKHGKKVVFHGYFASYLSERSFDLLKLLYGFI